MMKRLREQVAQHEVAIELTDGAKELLVDKGYDPAMGARPLRRAIQRFIEQRAAAREGDGAAGGTGGAVRRRRAGRGIAGAWRR
jgi:ATP-dependent Clp protease ATP-binding subunit ClpA